MANLRNLKAAGEDLSFVLVSGPARQARDIEGTGGNDRLRGTDRADVIKGLGGNDRLEGEDGNDRILGGKGDDRLEGDDGNDRLQGGAGNDRLDGDDGDDILTGGAGRDTFVFDDDNQDDVITDFDVTADVIYFDYQRGDDNPVYSKDDISSRDVAGGLLLEFDDGHTVLLEGLGTRDYNSIEFRFNAPPSGFQLDGVTAADAPAYADVLAI